MSQEKFKIEVNGVELQASPGQMLIEVTDAADIYIPRFCYHNKLSVAANCRMCLIDVDGAPKPLPACATPVTNGMKVFTRSERAVSAQKSVMEFLLINHPLDCPICDQGGECELQDIAMGFGRGISRYTERKRSVADEELGPLVSTDMTRCIHCTRCVRFGQEIAGIQELGAIGRGEQMEISTYIEKSVDHELSGNIIDLCPVGALNNKPYRFSARAWDMVQHPSVAPHDCLGSNIFLHVMRGEVKRVVPRNNDSINEAWASDRDRFSYAGIYAPDRLKMPMVREDGQWRETTWSEALDITASKLSALKGDLGVLISPSATTEEAYLAGRLTRHLGSASLDHRLRRTDFRQQDLDPVFPWLGGTIAGVETSDALLVVGSNLRKEVPLLAHRVRKAALQGANVSFINPAGYEMLFPVANYSVTDEPVEELGRLVQAAAGNPAQGELPVAAGLAGLTGRGQSSAADNERVSMLREASDGLILLGQIGMRHPRFAEIRLLAAELARLTGARLGYIPEGANAAGVSLAGALPHRDVGGEAVPNPGSTAADIVASPGRGLMLLGVEPEFDCADGPAAVNAMQSAELVLALSPWFSDSFERHADIVLPLGTFAETSGSFVNAAGEWQSFDGAAAPVGESRPGWKVLRVLGNLVGLPDCDYESAEEIRDELRARLSQVSPDNSIALDRAPEPATGAAHSADIPIYQIDGLVRRSEPLQQTSDGLAATLADSDDRKIA